MKILGIGICLAIMLGAILQIGHHLFIDINSALFVLGGATGFLVMKNNPQNHIKNFDWLHDRKQFLEKTTNQSFIVNQNI